VEFVLFIVTYWKTGQVKLTEIKKYEKMKTPRYSSEAEIKKAM
jgi:hypothetical protein